jgi:hypothetical protein
MEKNFNSYDMVSVIDGTIIGHPDRNFVSLFFSIFVCKIIRAFLKAVRV